MTFTICDLPIFGEELDFGTFRLTEQAEIGEELTIELFHEEYITEDDL